MDAVELISLYNTLFYVFLGIAALGLALTVFFFFYFDIPTVYAMITGKAREQTIQRMQEKHAKTGNLRFQYPGHTGDMKSGHTGRIGHSRRLARSERLSRNSHSGELGTETGAAANAQVANILAQAAEPETAVLQTEASETSVLGAAVVQIPKSDELGQTEMLQPKAAVNFRFEVTQTNVLIHTEERI